jgi:hypothetical protein
MQIDLLSTPRGELGLVGNVAFKNEVSGVIFDVGERSLTLEFGKSMDSLRLNIPVSEDFVDTLKKASYMHVCALEKGRMAYAQQVPLMKVSNEDDDFYMSDMSRGVTSLQKWLKDSKFAQSVHRDNLGDSTSNGGIMHREGLSRATLQVAPQLAQQLVKEQALAQRLAHQNVPKMAPPSLGPGSSNLGLGQMTPRSPRTPRGNTGGENQE